MPTNLDNLKTRRTEVATEIAALSSTSDPVRKKALYEEYQMLQELINKSDGPVETETLGYT